MLQKVSNLFFILCGVSIVVPQIFRFFSKEEDTLLAIIPWGWIILISGLLGLSIQLFSLLKNKNELGLSGLLLTLAFVFLIIGFALKELALNYKIILLIGVLFFGVWFMVPSSKENREKSSS